MNSTRLDEELVARGLIQSRSRARDAVLRGLVLVNGAPARKASQSIFANDVLALKDESGRYVSRAAFKLIHALDHFAIAVNSRHCLDIGASTGGFTQVLLERGAAHVTAVDVGHDQMVAQIADDPRVTLHEDTNARDLTGEIVSPDVSLIVVDVSFIPLHIALPACLGLVAANAVLVALLKPQFEVGRAHIGKGGIVSDEAQIERVCTEVSEFFEQQGWHLQGLIPSPMDGGDGNREFLIAAVKR